MRCKKGRSAISIPPPYADRSSDIAGEDIRVCLIGRNSKVYRESKKRDKTGGGKLVGSRVYRSHALVLRSLNAGKQFQFGLVAIKSAEEQKIISISLEF